jgi:hypothetical protein
MNRPRLRTIAVILASVAALFGTTVGAEHQLAFFAIDVPKASFTTAQGINPRGDIVGWYVDLVDKRTDAYLLQDGEFTKFDYPNAVYTDARGINARGEVVGAYRLLGEPAVNFHGYLRSPEGAFEPVDFPDRTNTIPQRITPNGMILGCRHENDLGDSMHGITMNRRTLDQGVDNDMPMSMNNGATPGGNLIVGLFTGNSSGGCRLRQQRRDNVTPAMGANGGGEVHESVELL